MQQGLLLSSPSSCRRLRRIITIIQQHHNDHCNLPYYKRYYYTNGINVKRDDPYAILGLSYGDGSTTKEIQSAYRYMASKLHPDVNTIDTPSIAIAKFQQLQKAYETLMRYNNVSIDINDMNHNQHEWKYSIWRKSDQLACDRTDVAGSMKKRPIMSAAVNDSSYYLGQSSYRNKRGEYLTADGSTTTIQQSSSSTVGRGINKWVTKSKEYIPWNQNQQQQQKQQQRQQQQSQSTASSSTLDDDDDDDNNKERFQ